MNFIRRTFREAMKAPGFSLLYVGGVAFTIAFTLVYGFILYGQLGPVYPEYDRGSTYYIENVVTKRPEYMSQSGVGKPFIDQFLRDSLKSIDKVTAVVKYNSVYPMVQTDGRGQEFHIEQRYTEPSFFNFYKYEFLAGRPFSQDEFDAKDRVAVISQNVAKRLFQNPEDAIGEQISINHTKYRITGVFREGSALNVDSYAEVFLPYNFNQYESDEWLDIYKGSLTAIVKVKPGKGELLKTEINDLIRRINLVDTAASKFCIPQVLSHAEHVLTDKIQLSREDDNYQVAPSKSAMQLAKPFLIGILVLLVVPALNISGLIGARMDRLRADIAVRRCFGATRKRLMGMVLTENLVLTLTGGIAGLLIAWIIAVFAGNLLLQFMPLAHLNGTYLSDHTSIVTGEMAFAPILFILTLLMCVVLNIISAWIPAHKALRRQITDSLNSKR